jgi:hypothetical protein
MLIEFYTAMGWDENGRPLKDNPGGAWHRYPAVGTWGGPIRTGID